MTRRSSKQSIDPAAMFMELRETFSRELVGLVIFLVGGLLLVSLLGGEDTPWLRTMIGWTAPFMVLSLLVLGAVLMLRRRAGYWSAEALVGVELLILALTVGAYVVNAPQPDWSAPLDGRNGGLVGWSLGSLLVGALGRWPTMLLLLLLGGLGFALLLRFTPLIYVAHGVGRLVPLLAVFWSAIDSRLPRVNWGDGERTGDVLPDYWQDANFVAPDDEEEDAAPDEWIEADPASPATATIAAAAPASARTQAPPQSAKKAAGSADKRRRPRRPMRHPDELPSVELLALDSGEYGGADVRVLAQRIEATLEDFNVPVKVVHVESGPTVTQFGVEPQYLERAGQRRKVRVSRIVNLADDLALALAAPAVRIEAPVPGRPYVGIEVPNPDKTLVSLRGILESAEMRKAPGDLLLPLGRDTAGKAVVMDLARAPHMLIAGQTGAGKSVCINTIVAGLLMQHGPESLQFVMVDPKMVELPGYNGIPHLMGKVITDMDQVMGALTWLLLQMDDRYRTFREVGVRNIDAYNLLARKRKSLDHMPYIVLIVDELADLMMTAPEDIERQICRLAQMARATGIHLILATQRPSTDVVTGLIKANFPTRIAFAVTSQIDSRVILDTPGAERLLGRGDMLLMRPDASKLFRVQGCFVADDEITQLVQFWKEAEIDVELSATPPWNSLLDRMDQEDEIIYEAMDVLRGMKTCSTSMLQRKLRIGYPKAARLMEQLEAKGVVGPDMGGGQGREVLLKNEEEEEDEEEW